MDPSFDYIVIGGGTAGVVIASRLKEYLPDSRIALFEAGPNAVDHPAVNDVANPLNYMPLIKEGLFVDYSTTPQEHLDNRTIRNPAGRMLSGATAVNPGMWMRASAADLDIVTERAGNERFKYDNMLKYYKRTETDFESTTDKERYGSAGPIHTVGGRKYPLRDHLQQSAEKLGHKYNPNRGDPVGLGELTQCWRPTSESTATRQHSAKVYNLSGVEVFCDSPVARILLDDSKRATGIELTSGKSMMATKEVILSCGTQISPKILLLSGIGPAEELAKHNIPQLVDSPAVGQNLSDHIAMMTYYKFKDASKGYARPFNGHMKPEYGQGIPFEFALFANIPDAELSPYLKDDNVCIPGFLDPVRNFTMRIFFKTFLSKKNAAISISMKKKKKTKGMEKPRKQQQGVYTEDSKAQHWLLGANRSHYLNIVYYFAFLTNPVAYPTVKEDGCHFTVGAFNMLPLSRGTVTLKSADPNDNPVCDPQYLSNSIDRFVMRRAVRESIRLLETDPLASEVEGEVAPAGANYMPLTAKSSDDEIDARIRAFTGTIAHPMGTCALGTVLDDEFRVKGVDGLRVCDASVFPEPIAAMPCCTVYALAEMCADLVAGRA